MKGQGAQMLLIVVGVLIAVVGVVMLLMWAGYLPNIGKMISDYVIANIPTLGP